MKINFPKDYKRFFTLEDLDACKVVKAMQKDDETPVKDWAEYAVNEGLWNGDGVCGGDYCVKVLEVSAEYARNNRIYNAYGDGSGNMDIWITAAARTTNGFIEIGAYLSDIWQTGATPYKEHMFVQVYTRKQ